MRVSAVGGTPSPVTTLNPKRQEAFHFYPVFLPDGRHFLYFIPGQNSGVYAGSLDARPEEQGPRQILATNFLPNYVPSQDSGLGWLLFLREQTLVAQSFDDKRLELVGEPLPLAEQVRYLSHYGYFSASTNGVLAYMSGSVSQFSQLTWFDRQGKPLGTVGESGPYYGGVTLSPEGARVAAINGGHISLLDLLRGTDTRFTFGKGNSGNPIWSPDGNRIIFGSNRDGVMNLYQKPVSGAKEEELLLESSENKIPHSWSSDGRFLIYSTLDPKRKNDLWVLRLGDRKPFPFLRTEFREFDAHFSPDMRWVAYVSDESGSNEIWVRGLSETSSGEISPAASGKWLVSKGGGIAPRWRGDGKELYYRTTDGRVMAVEVTPGPAFQTGTPTPLFQTALDAGSFINSSFAWDVAKDGRRFLIVEPASEKTSTPFTVVLNWQMGLKK